MTSYYRKQDPNAKTSEQFLTEGRLELLWAGDLDGDAKLDLVLRCRVSQEKPAWPRVTSKTGL